MVRVADSLASDLGLNPGQVSDIVFLCWVRLIRQELSKTRNTWIHTLPRLYSSIAKFLQHNTSHKLFSYTTKIQLSFIDTATNRSRKVIYYSVKQTLV